MTERIDTATQRSKIAKHDGVAYLCGQVGEGEALPNRPRTVPPESMRSW